MQTKRQVVFIMTDTTRKDMLGCYGNNGMITPHLDQLAQEGIRYESAYTVQPVCGPARSAIFTGLSPHSNCVIANSLPLGLNVKTIGERLTDTGITCGYIGKWHLDGGDYFGLGTCPPGWNPDYWYDMKCYLDEHSPQERVLSRKASLSYEGLDENFTYAHRCTQRALNYLEQHKDTDFFLTVSYDEPHGPSLCPEPYCSMYTDYTLPENPNYLDSLENKPYYQKLWGKAHLGKTMEVIAEHNKKYALFLGCNSFVDYEIGHILNWLKKELPDAMIIFTSDHGDGLGAHRLYGKGACVYDEICNVPLIIKGGKQGVISHKPISHLDLVPTLMAYYQLPIPKLLEGTNLLNEIYFEEKEDDKKAFMEFTRYEVDHDGFGGLQMMRAVVTSKYKMAVHLLDSDELYDRENDPYELNNLINDDSYAEIRKELHDYILEHMNETRDPYRGYQWKNRPYRKDTQDSWPVDGFTRQRENEEYEPRQLDYSTGLEMVKAVRKK